MWKKIICEFAHWNLVTKESSKTLTRHKSLLGGTFYLVIFSCESKKIIWYS